MGQRPGEFYKKVNPLNNALFGFQKTRHGGRDALFGFQKAHHGDRDALFGLQKPVFGCLGCFGLAIQLLFCCLCCFRLSMIQLPFCFVCRLCLPIHLLSSHAASNCRFICFFDPSHAALDGRFSLHIITFYCHNMICSKESSHESAGRLYYVNAPAITTRQLRYATVT